MMYRTHKAGGTLAMVLAFEYLRSKDMLVPGLNEYVQLLVMYPAASWGSTAPDLDHHWGSVKEKTPFNLLVHTILHKTSHPRHRSWQTHSLLVTGSFLALLFSLVMYGHVFFPGLEGADWAILRMIVVGMLIGVGSHLFYDMMSTAGIPSWPGGPKLRIVPRHRFFGTDSKWETFIYYISIVITCLVIVGIFVRRMGWSIPYVPFLS